MGLQFLGDIHASGVDLDIMNYVAGISACSWAKQAKHNELMLTFNCARLLNVELLELSRFWMVLGLFPLGKQNSTYRCSGLVLAKSFALLGGASCGEVGRDIHTSRTTPNDRLLVEQPMPTLFLADMLYLSFKSGMNQPTLVGACCCTVKRYS